MAAYTHMADLFAKVNCTYCQEEINGVRVQCAVCIDFDICPQCFASGAEIGSHKSDHSYRIAVSCSLALFKLYSQNIQIFRTTVPLVYSEVVEELLLLEGTEVYGFGNWKLISRYVETRTAEEVRDEYISRYLNENIGKATWSEIGDCRPTFHDHTREDKGPLYPEVISRLPPLDASPEEARQLGYMAHRDDYERVCLFAKVNCTYCQEEINGIRVRCAVCIDFDICPQCFASGAEIGSHKSDHSYRIANHCTVSVFGGCWTGREELLLLEGTEVYGFGNWELICRHVETRTAAEVRDEYISRYLNGNIGKATWSEIGDCRPTFHDHTHEDKGPLSPEVISQ